MRAVWLILKSLFWAFLALVTVVTIVLLTVDFNFLKEKIEKAASEALGQDIRIAGDIHAGIESLRPSLGLRDVSAGSVQIGLLEFTLSPERKEAAVPRQFLVHARDVFSEGRKLGDYRLKVQLDPQGISAPEVEGHLGKAGLKGNFSYLENKLHIDVALSSVDYSEITGSFQGGKARAALKLDGIGATQSAIMSTLNGEFWLAGGEGRMQAEGFRLWASSLISALFVEKEKEVKIHCLIADFDIINGIAYTKLFFLDTEQAVVTGEGTIDFIKEIVDMKFSPRPKKSSLISLATPVLVRGPFDDVSVKPSPGAVAGKVGGLLLGAVNPAAALLPLMKMGAGDKGACKAYLEEYGAL